MPKDSTPTKAQQIHELAEQLYDQNCSDSSFTKKDAKRMAVELYEQNSGQEHIS